MARRSHDDAFGVAGAETIIGSGVTVKGELVSESDIIIDGLLEGNISTTGDVTVGVNAKIKANIQGGNVTVAGHLTGNIKATGEATIRETGEVKGDITSSGLVITSGGVFIGRNIMQSAPVLDIPGSDEEPSAEPQVESPGEPDDAETQTPPRSTSKPFGRKRKL